MSDSGSTQIDLAALKGVITQLGTLSTTLGQLSNTLADGSSLNWTGADKDGTTLRDNLTPTEQGGIQAVRDTKGSVDGIIENISKTVGLWNNTEGVNIEMNT
jgi:hypothetical protein